jgi:hypothetical protein
MFLLAGCAGTKMNPDGARQVIATDLKMAEKQVQVDKVTEMGGTVLAEASLRLAFVLQKDGKGQWHIVKIRRSDNQWEPPDQFFAPRSDSSLTLSLKSAFLWELKGDPKD